MLNTPEENYSMETPSDRQRNLMSWLRRHAIPLTTVEAGSGFADLQPLKPVIGSARIVALGEATHGTREFFQLKHRLLEFLVTEMGFTTFAIEANWPESLAVNDYVLHGRGDPAKVLAGLHCWTWDTEEVLNLILWMRQYNMHSTHKAKVTFAGIDAQFTALAAATIRRYLSQVDPAFATEIGPRLMDFEEDYLDYRTLSEARVAALHCTVEDLAGRLLAEKRTYVARSTAQEWRLACQHARILRQAGEQGRAGDDNKTRYMIRDRAMAENVEWILDNEGPRCKMVVWAHNGHVARDPRGVFDGTVESMGMHLARRFDPEVVVIGFAFGEGSFQAVVKEGGRRGILREVAVGSAPDETLDAVLARTGIPVFLVDLRRMDDDAAPWFRETQVTREIGAFFEGTEAMCQTIVPMARYDALAFIGKTTRARPNPD
jgi:erythromycin esterase